MKGVRKTHIRVLNALLSDCKRSDREIAKVVGISQPTITRLRQKLINKGIIKGFMAIPDYAKIGYEFGAITLCQMADKTINLSEHSLLVTASTITGEGDYVIITLHRSMDDYRAFRRKVKALAVVIFATQGLEIKPVRLEA